MRQMRDAALMLMALLVVIGCSDQNKIADTEAQNKATVRRVHAELAKGNLAIFDEVLAPNYLRHCQAMPPEFQELSDKEVFKDFLQGFVDAFPGYQDTVLFLLAEGDLVAYVSEMTGTQTGVMNGLPPTGKSFTLTNIVIHRFEDGKIAESWVSWDNLSMLSQLGHFPPPPPGEPPAEK